MEDEIFLQFDRSFDFFLTDDKKGGLVACSRNRQASIKDMVESSGVPHTEVGALLFQGREIPFSHIPVSPGKVHVREIQVPFDVTRASLLRPRPLGQIRFIADTNVVRLGRLMILLGFDVNYDISYSDRDIADKACSEGRIVLTRDTGLLKRRKIDFAKRIRADLPYDQLVETIGFFGLENRMSFFSRCTTCNTFLEKRPKSAVFDLLEPKTRLYYDDFFQCRRCGRVFWRGSHYDHIRQTLARIGIFSDHA